MLQELISFGNTGEEASLLVILNDLLRGSSYELVPDNVAAKVIARFIALFKASSANEKRTLCWGVLSSLCDSITNSSRENFKRKLVDSSILKYVAEGCGKFPLEECNASLYFLSHFTDDNDLRQSLVLKHAGLLEALLSLLDSSVSVFDLGPFSRIDQVLTFLDKVLSSDGPLEEFVKAGGFARLNDAAEKLVSRGVEEYNETGAVEQSLEVVIGKVLFALSRFQNAIWRQVKEWALRPLAEMWSFCYTEDGARRYTELLNNAVDIFPSGGSTGVAILGLFIDVYIFLIAFTRPADDTREEDRISAKSAVRDRAVEHYMLAPGPISGCCLLVQCLRQLRTRDDLHWHPSEKILRKFDGLIVQQPAARAALEAEIGEKLVYCSLPWCNVSNLKRSRLKKCERCMSVSYCCKGHQVAHWKEHKPHCCTASTVATPAILVATGDGVVA